MTVGQLQLLPESGATDRHADLAACVLEAGGMNRRAAEQLVDNWLAAGRNVVIAATEHRNTTEGRAWPENSFRCPSCFMSYIKDPKAKHPWRHWWIRYTMCWACMADAAGVVDRLATEAECEPFLIGAST